MQQIDVDVNKLVFDTDNPRFPSTEKGKSDDEIIKWMLENERVIELMASIGEKGYFPGEPLLVTDLKGKYLVVEGNRRLTALKLLLNPSRALTKKKSVQETVENATHRPASVPAIVFPNREEILKYLGYRHITGVQEWGALEKSRYLRQLFDVVGSHSAEEKYKSLAKSIGSNPTYVKKLLVGFTIYEHIAIEESFYNIEGLNETNISFSLLTTALNYSNILKYLNINFANEQPTQNLSNKHLEELTRWIFEKTDGEKSRLGESRRLKDLNKILGNEQALKAFKSGVDIEKALLLTDAPEEIFRKSINNAYELLGYGRNYFTWVTKPTNGDLDKVSSIQQLARDLASTIKSRLLEPNED